MIFPMYVVAAERQTEMGLGFSVEVCLLQYWRLESKLEIEVGAGLYRAYRGLCNVESE